MVFEKDNQEFLICTKYKAYDGATISRNLLKVSSVTVQTEGFCLCDHVSWLLQSQMLDLIKSMKPAYCARRSLTSDTDS